MKETEKTAIIFIGNSKERHDCFMDNLCYSCGFNTEQLSAFSIRGKDELSSNEQIYVKADYIAASQLGRNDFDSLHIIAYEEFYPSLINEIVKHILKPDSPAFIYAKNENKDKIKDMLKIICHSGIDTALEKTAEFFIKGTISSSPAFCPEQQYIAGAIINFFNVEKPEENSLYVKIFDINRGESAKSLLRSVREVIETYESNALFLHYEISSGVDETKYYSFFSMLLNSLCEDRELDIFNTCEIVKDIACESRLTIYANICSEKNL